MKTIASEEHLKLSGEIKAVHSTLRQKTKQLGPKRAWHEHLEAKSKLSSYAKAMKELAINHWEGNNRKQEETSKKSQPRSRITWTVNYCCEYFFNDNLIRRIRQRELRLLDELKIDCTEINQAITTKPFPFVERIKLLDVGSCYNPFKPFSKFDVTAIDIAPAVEGVFECDFLNVILGKCTEVSENDNKPSNSISKFGRNCYDIVVFSLLLEYLPTSEQRIKCCEKAYSILRSEGLLVIITPDSKHNGVNAKLMKTWRYALAQLGFGRIKIEKLEHITCMAYRKCLDPEISLRWSRMHKETYMEYRIEIPQDFNDTDSKNDGDYDDDDPRAAEEKRAKSESSHGNSGIELYSNSSGSS